MEEKQNIQIARRWLEFENTGLHIESIDQFKNSYHSLSYRMAIQKLEAIIRQNFWGQKGKVYNDPVNILAFVGGRGSGKSSVMMSLIEALKNYSYYNETGQLDELFASFLREENGTRRAVTFTCLERIDGAMLESGEDIFSLVLAQLYQKFVDEENEHRLHIQDDYDYKKREVLKKLENIFRIIREIQVMNAEAAPKSAAGSYLNELDSLASSQKVRREFQDLINSFTDLMLYRREKMGKYAVDHYVVITIDDIDLNVENGFSMMEKINRYLMVKNVIVVLAVDYQQMQKLAVRHFYKMYPKVDGILREGVSYAGKIATDYLDKVLPMNYRIYVSDINDRYVDDQIGIKDREAEIGRPEDETAEIRKAILRKIYWRTGICFDSQGVKRHFYQMSTLRQLNNFYLMLNSMEHVDVCQMYMQSCRKEKGKEAALWSKIDDHWNFMFQDLMNRMAIDKLHISADPAGTVGIETGISLFPSTRQFLENLESLDLRRAKNAVIFFHQFLRGRDGFKVYEDSTKAFSYGNLVETIYDMGRIQSERYKPLVHCLLAYFSYMFTREYLFQKEKLVDETGQRLVPDGQIEELIGRSVVESWGKDLLPRIGVDIDEMQDVDEYRNPPENQKMVQFGTTVHLEGTNKEKKRLLSVNRAFGFNLTELSIQTLEDAVRLICDIEMLYALFTDIKSPYYASEGIKKKIRFKKDIQKGGRYWLLPYLQGLSDLRNTLQDTTGVFNILNFIPNAFGMSDRLQSFEEALVEGMAEYCQGMNEAAGKSIEDVKKMIKASLKPLSPAKQYLAWEKKYGKNSLPFPLHWFDMSYNILKRTWKFAKSEFPKNITRENEGQLFDYISRIYENMNDQLNAQYIYYSSGKSNCYDFAAQFAECPAVKYFRGKDLRDKEKDSVLERRREFWAQYFVRMRIEQEI